MNISINKTSFLFSDLMKVTFGNWKNLEEYTSYDNFSVKSILTDTRKDNSGSLFVALIGIKYDAHDYLAHAIMSGAKALCLQKGRYSSDEIPKHIPILEVNDTLKAYQNIANYHRNRLNNLTLIGITGSNGKTSVKEMLFGLLSQKFGDDKVYATKDNTNNLIGVPLNILNITNLHRYAVIEMGSNHPGEIRALTEIANPDIAVITSIGPSHLEYFINIEGVIKEKLSILSNFNNPENATAVIPYQILTQKSINKVLSKYSTYLIKELSDSINLEHNITLPTNNIVNWKYNNASINGTCFDLHWHDCNVSKKISWKVPGRHQVCNAATAAAVATSVGLSCEEIALYLKSCKLSGMRMRINVIDNITWVNDAYNANPASMMAGIQWLKDIKNNPEFDFNKILVILGDMLELGCNSIDFHDQIIKDALEMLPGVTIVGVGPLMSQVITEINKSETSEFLHSVQKSEYIIPFIENIIEEGDLLYLKGSRGIALEKIENNFLHLKD